MRKERYKLIGMLLFTILMLILGVMGFYVRESDYEFLFMTVMIGTMPYGYCILGKNKKGNYDAQYTDFSYIKFLFKFFIGSLIGVLAFIPMLWILISNMKKENQEFSERAIYFTNKIDVSEREISALKDKFSNKYLSVLEKYPECLEDSKNALSLLVRLNQQQNKLIHIQLYEGNIFYSGLISTLIVSLKLKKVFKQIEQILLKLINYSHMMSEHDYMDEDDDCLCEWADELGYYVECIDQEMKDANWLIYKHQEMFSFFLKRDLVVFGIVALFLLCVFLSG